jgi:sarcosine oxidase / L-pipecolate oxidase
MIADYTDPVYARLATESRKQILQDSDLRQHLYQQGMSFICDGYASRFTKIFEVTLDRARSVAAPGNIVEMSTRDEVFQRIHGPHSQPRRECDLDGQSKWNKGYCNLEAAFIDAEACIKVYYHRCLESSSISFRCGSAVEQIVTSKGRAEGVLLADGNMVAAETVIVAAGAWSNKLVYLGTRLSPIGHEVAWIKVTTEEAKRWHSMSITTNLSTGLNMFPPYKGEVKILRRSPGYVNMVTIPHPEQEFKSLRICHPRTIVTNPTDVIPAEAEAAMRQNLREIMPDLADRAFDRTKICWYATTHPIYSCSKYSSFAGSAQLQQAISSLHPILQSEAFTLQRVVLPTLGNSCLPSVTL